MIAISAINSLFPPPQKSNDLIFIYSIQMHDFYQLSSAKDVIVEQRFVGVMFSSNKHLFRQLFPFLVSSFSSLCQCWTPPFKAKIGSFYLKGRRLTLKSLPTFRLARFHF